MATRKYTQRAKIEWEGPINEHAGRLVRLVVQIGGTREMNGEVISRILSAQSTVIEGVNINY